MVPGFDIDQNRQFPGKSDGHPTQDLAHRLTEDLKHADLVVEIRGARLGFVEIPQAMIRETQVDNAILEGVTLLDIARASAIHRLYGHVVPVQSRTRRWVSNLRMSLF